MAVNALRLAGHDVFWVRTELAGATDERVLAHAVAEDRILLTFDKDFGDLAFRAGLPATCGIILSRIRIDAPDTLARPRRGDRGIAGGLAGPVRGGGRTAYPERSLRARDDFAARTSRQRRHRRVARIREEMNGPVAHQEMASARM